MVIGNDTLLPFLHLPRVVMEVGNDPIVEEQNLGELISNSHDYGRK